MSKVMKIVTILMIMLMVVSISTSVFAASLEGFVGDVGTAADNTELAGISQSITSTILTIGMVLAVVVLMVLGIKYMIGSTEEKAEYKKTFIPYLVGAVLIFAASGIAQLVIGFAEGITV